MAIKVSGTTIVSDARIATFSELIIDGTGAIKLPVGTNAQKPTGQNGLLRYTSDAYSSSEGWPEFYTDVYGDWVKIGDVDVSSTQQISNKEFGNCQYNGTVDVIGSIKTGIIPVPALEITCGSGNYFTKTINGNSTFTFSGAPASRAYSFILELTHTSGTVTWPSTVRWPGDTPPTLTAGKTHLFVFITDNGGATWRGVSNVDYSN